MKEVKFFQKEMNKFDKNKYLSNFPECSDKKIYLDASPPYLYPNSFAPQNIKNTLAEDEVYIFILIRDPISAVFSHYLHDLKSHVGRLSSPRVRPKAFSLRSPAVSQKFMHLKFPKIHEFEQNFPESTFVFPMKDLFNGKIRTKINEVFSINLKDFDSSHRSNAGGFVPRYFYGGENGSSFEQDGILYKVPAYAMVSAAEERSEILHDVPQDVADRIFALADTFTKEITFQTSYFQSIIDDHMRICDRYNVDCPIKSNGSTVEFQATDGTVSDKVLKMLEVCN